MEHAGIGTATYYEPRSGKIATLGHGIVDRDTDKLITLGSGEITTSTVTKIKKGEKVYEQRENEKSSCTYADLHFCNKCNRMRWSNEV